jgi:ribonucleoside-diphosphate reductase alpha chain
LIEATNPCGEQPLHPFDSCNLGSINLGALVQGEGSSARFDWDEFKSIIHTTTRFLDNVIEANKYPLPQIDNMSKTTRRIGLGVMGFADALYKLGIRYNSQEGCAWGERAMQVLDDESHLASELLADERGVFPAWEGSDWEKRGRKMRNSYTTTVAPTGTISIIANCSGGIEPMFSLAFIRQVMKDARGRPTIMREVNYVFERTAKARGFYSDELVDSIVEAGTLQHRDEVPEDVKQVFVTAHDITPYWHMKMQSAFQRHCDSSISKTINFPREATVDDVRQIFELAIDEDVKGVTVYRDGCRDLAADGAQALEPGRPRGSRRHPRRGRGRERERRRAVDDRRSADPEGRGRSRGAEPDQAARDHELPPNPADDALREHAREGLRRSGRGPRARGVRPARQGRRRRELGPRGDLPHPLPVAARERQPQDGDQAARGDRVEPLRPHEGRADHVAR